MAKILEEQLKAALVPDVIKNIFDDGMDKVLTYDEGFLKEISKKMSDVVMPAYMMELRYLKQVVTGVDNVTKEMKKLQDNLVAELNAVVPNPQNAADTISQINKIVERFVKKATEIVETKIGLRELLPEELVKQTKILDTIEDGPSTEEPEVPTKGNESEPALTLSQSIVSNPITTLVLKTPDDITNALLNNILQTIQKNVQKGGAADKPDANTEIHHTPDITSEINNFITEHKSPRIPDGGSPRYTGNISQLINQIMGKKVSAQQPKHDDDIQGKPINNLIEIIKESKLPNNELKKILDQATAQIKNSQKNRGGTRKKRLV
jgi:hypothetical protein